MTVRNKKQSPPRSAKAGASESAPIRPFPRAWMVAAVLAIAMGAVYGRALKVPFIHDDKSSILTNNSIKSLWPLVGSAEHPAPLTPPADLPTSARPLVNLSFAINYHFGGLTTTGYHVVNLVLHFCSSLLLWAITCRTLCLPYFAGRFETSANRLALAVALLWALHPLQTEAVIYATQRTELMMALFYLATFYCSLRYWSATAHTIHRAIWLTLAILACLAGMASKEVMISAPLMVLLYERTFISGSLVNALRRSWPLYVGLASTWVLLLGLALNSPHGQTAGFGMGVSALAWWLTQTKILLMYLRLVVWPSPLLIDYQLPYLTKVGESWMYAVPVLLLGVATLVLLVRNRPAGFLGTWIFAILAPTSLVPIVTEMAAERRMYLPLAAIAVLLIIGVAKLVEYLIRLSSSDRPKPYAKSLPIFVTFGFAFLLAVVFGVASARRLEAYSDEANLWRQVLQFQPDNPLAHGNLGGILLSVPGKLNEAIHELQVALALKSDYPDALNNIGVAFTHAGRLSEAIDALQTVLASEPNFPAALINLGLALTNTGRIPEAIECFERELRLHPEDVLARNALAVALYRSGQSSKAIEQLRLAVQYDENNVNAQSNLGQLLHAAGKPEEALPHLEKAIRLGPDLTDAHNALADAYSRGGQHNQAIEHYQAILKQAPDFYPAYANLARTLALVNRSDEALATAQKGIEVARSAGQPAAAEHIEEWLQHYRAELSRTDAVTEPSKLQPSNK